MVGNPWTFLSAWMQLSFPVFVTALMAFVGWFLFVVFGGLGLAGIPIDFIRVSPIHAYLPCLVGWR